MLALQAPRSTAAAKQLRQSHAGAFWISEWKQISVETCGIIKSMKDLECQQERKRKHSIVCPGAVESRRGVNSDSFQRDGQLNLRAASLQAMTILFCPRRPLWASTESSI